RQALGVGGATEGGCSGTHVDCDMALGGIDADEADGFAMMIHHPTSLMRARAQTTVRVDRDVPAGATRSVAASNDHDTIGLPAGLRPSAETDHPCNGRHRRAQRKPKPQSATEEANGCAARGAHESCLRGPLWLYLSRCPPCETLA